MDVTSFIPLTVYPVHTPPELERACRRIACEALDAYLQDYALPSRLTRSRVLKQPNPS